MTRLPRRVTFVTSNRDKVREVRSILGALGFRVDHRLRALPERQADSLEAVVDGNLDAIRSATGVVLVEDSGLFLEGLGGFPGVYSAYVYDTVGLAGVLRLLRGRSRRARFRTVVGIRWGTRRWRAVGEVRGRITTRLRGLGGFGYDPIFVPQGSSLTFAERT